MRNITCLALVALAAACGSSTTSSPDAAGPGPDTKPVQPCEHAAALRDDGYTCAASSACLAGAQCIAGTCQIPSGRCCL
jgi:hypothetical protein